MEIVINDKPCTAVVGEKLSKVAQDSKSHVGYVCGGHGICQTCYVTILEGLECLSPLSEIEQAFLSAKQVEAGGRLACQAVIVKEGTLNVLSRPEEVRRMLLQNPLSLFSYGAELGNAAAERFIPGVSNVIERIKKGEVAHREGLSDLLDSMGAAVKFSASSAAANLPFKEQFGALVDFIKKFLPFAQPSEMKPEPLERVTVSVKKKNH